MIAGLLRLPSTVLYGRGMRTALADHVPDDARRALIITDSRMATQDSFEQMRQAVAARVPRTDVLSSVNPELPVQDVTAAAEAVTANPDVIIAVGGGSVLDFAKVLAVLLTHGGHPSDYYGDFAVPGPTMKLIAIPTTAGTGSEVTPVAVLTDPSREMKIGISSPHLIPSVAICDPELTDTSPAPLTAASGTDALSHCIESLTSVGPSLDPAVARDRVFVGHNSLAALVALEGVRLISRSLRTAVGVKQEMPVDAARDDMMFGALAGGAALGSAGTAAAHALQYPIGALTKTPHGVGVGLLLPYVMAFNRTSRMHEFAMIGAAVGGTGDESALSEHAVSFVASLMADIGIPTRLSDLSLTPSSHDEIVEQTLTIRRLVANNPRELTRDALHQILMAAEKGDLSLAAAEDHH